MLKRKNITIRFLYVLTFFTIISLFHGCQGMRTKNNFNGGFEIKKDNINEPEGWYATSMPQTQNYVDFAWDSTVKHSGAHSISIAIDSTHPPEVIDYNWTRTYPDFKINKKYSISGWIKTINLKTTAFLVVQCWNDNNKMIGFFTNQGKHSVIGTTDWTLVKYDFTVSEGTKEVRVRAGIQAPDDNGGKVSFDDIKIE